MEEMDEEQIERYMYNEAVSSEWRGNDLYLYDSEGHIVNIYRDYDLETLAIENHNKYINREI